MKLFVAISLFVAGAIPAGYTCINADHIPHYPLILLPASILMVAGGMMIWTKLRISNPLQGRS